MWTIPVTPMATPRPRLGKNGVFNEPKYTKYKNDLVNWISILKIPKGDYDFIHAHLLFYIFQ